MAPLVGLPAFISLLASFEGTHAARLNASAGLVAQGQAEARATLSASAAQGLQLGSMGVVDTWSECSGVFFKGEAPDVQFDTVKDERRVCRSCPSSSDQEIWPPEACRGQGQRVCDLFVQKCLHESKYDKDGECRSRACPTCRSCTPKKHWTVPPYNELKEAFFQPSNSFLAMDVDTSRGIPRWSSYRVRADLWRASGWVPRTSGFYKDPDLDGLDVGGQEYSRQPDLEPLHNGENNKMAKPYVKGHLAPNQFFTWAAAPEFASNFFSNVAPQLGVANHPSWYIGAEKILMDLVTAPENANFEFYIVTGTAGSLNDNRTDMKAKLHGAARHWQKHRNDRLLAALPAFWWTAFLKVDEEGSELQSGGFIGENFLYRDPKSGAALPLTVQFDTLGLLEEELRRRCENCTVNIFPGAEANKLLSSERSGSANRTTSERVPIRTVQFHGRPGKKPAPSWNPWLRRIFRLFSSRA